MRKYNRLLTKILRHVRENDTMPETIIVKRSDAQQFFADSDDLRKRVSSIHRDVANKIKNMVIIFKD